MASANSRGTQLLARHRDGAATGWLCRSGSRRCRIHRCSAPIIASLQVAIAFIAGIGLGIVLSTVAGELDRRSRRAKAPAQPEHDPQRYRLHDGILWYLAAWHRNGGVR